MSPGRTIPFAALLCLALATPALAALPPHYQRARELTAVIDAAAEVLDFRPIERVQRVGDDLYRVESEACTLDVRIVGLPMPQGMVGARRFKAVPGEPACR